MTPRATAWVCLAALTIAFYGCGGDDTSGGMGTGGAPGSGGATATGGAPGTGGAMGTGGNLADGGTGGAPGTGGGVDAGPADAPGGGGDSGVSPMMSFFVTSRGIGTGGNLGGLTGADAFCTQLATAVSATLGAKTWHAYLSTTTTNARDRIGPGPWRNAAGVVIANNLQDLHDQFDGGAALDATWPIGATNIALDERGAPVPSNPLVHDILTGSNADGTLLTGANCNNWASQATTDTAQIGHSNRTGGGRPPSWNAAHSVGCAEPTNGMNNQANTVSSGGGRGSIYCFALP